MRCLLSFVLLLLPVNALVAQVDRSSLIGTVSDPHGGRVPAVTVKAIQDATGLERETVTNAKGTYVLENLPIGLYVVSFKRAGFSDFIADQVKQDVGHTGTLNVQLSIATGSQQVSVTQPVVQLDTVSATVGAPVEQAQVRQLPLNGRNWASLTALTPGAIDNGSSDQRNIRFAGHGLDDNNLTLDGVDATAIYNQEQRQYVRLNIPLDSISEFQGVSQNFGADAEGGTAGGQISVASRSGSNTLHAGASDFFRNQVLDARSPFDGSSPNPFLLNQFAGDVSGAVVPNQTFFYANYEGIRQRLGQTQIGLVPSPSFISQTESASPALASLLSAYPMGSSPTSNPQIWNYKAEANQVDNEDAGMIRLDEHVNDRTTAFARFNTDYAKDSIPLGSLNGATAADTIFRNGVVELLRVISPALVNEAKFGANQQIYHTANLTGTPFSINVASFSGLSSSKTSDVGAKTFSFIDDFSWVKGRHKVKLGMEIRWIQMNQGNSQDGTLTYTSPAKFLLNQADSASYTALLPLKRLRKAQYWGYIQDEFQVTENLTLTMGLRYNYFNVFHEVANRAIPFDFATCGATGYCHPGADFSFPRSNDVDPRLAVAWAHGQTVIRAGGGIYHSDGQEDDQNLPISNDVDRYSLTAKASPGLSFPLYPYLQSVTGIVSPRLLYRNRKDMYVAAWTASVQRDLPGKVVGTATYLGNKGTDLLTTTYVNVINPLTGTRPYPAFGTVAWRGNDSNSTFHALQFNARRAFQRGLLFSVNYMWSHSINDGSIGGGESDTVQDVFCRSCDKASSDFDVRQVFNTSLVYRLPFHGAAGFLSGWELSGVGTSRSGLPVNVTFDPSSSLVPGGYTVANSERPNLVPGVSLIPAGGQTPTNWINPAAFATPAAQTFGNAGRNLLRGPGLWQVDVALAKNIAISERLALHLRAEVFNVFNRAQYGNPLADLSTPLNFGQITTPVNQGATGSGTPRQIQLAARFSF